MLKNNRCGLFLPKKLLISASGIDPKIIAADEKSGKLDFDEQGNIWYHNALNYVVDKWEEGALMYSPISEKEEHNFASRVLSRLDDQISAGNLEMVWCKEYKD